MSPVESAAVREKRLELQELEQAKDFWGPAAYEAMRQALQDDLAELQGEATKPTTTPKPELPMPKITLNPTDPSKRIAHLVGLIDEAAQKGEKLYWAQQEVRKLCEVHRLEVPACAQKVDRAKAPAKSTPAPKPPPPAREGLEGHLEAAIDLGRAIERHVTTPKKLDDVRTHVRGIRRQVWSLLADLENLSPDQLREIEPDLALLDSASATAYQMAQKVVKP